MSLQKPELYQITISGERNGKEYYMSILQIVADQGDLECVIDFFTEGDTQLNVKSVKLEVGFSPYFHDCFLEGVKNV